MKKELNIILIIVVISLWGTVAYKYFKNYFFASTIESENIVANNYQNLEIVRDTIAFQYLDRDPFLATPSPSIAEGKNNNSIVKPKYKNAVVNPVQQEIIPMPEIIYYGYIKSGTKEFALLKVNETLLRLQKQQVKNNIRVKSFSKNDLIIIFGGQEYTFAKN
ncbi:hypothetical protein ACLI09_16995 [Flavobacterium sp. RHBU_24]|uniref:hypothetical protein n=1 Tax=Flavobacterium sp. RHBU_24 TaxID=3391185 RepID=UPI003984EF99